MTTINNWCLYIIMRTDMASLTPGKAMAQACHAGNHFQSRFGREKYFKQWAKQGDGFGTTIVLEGVCMELIQEYVDNALLIGTDAEMNVFAGFVTDETYPVEDGNVTHTLPIITCGYIFMNRFDDDMMERLKIHELELLTTPYAGAGYDR